jgi:hypothetical protein
MPEFQSLNAYVLGVSTDSVHSHREYAKSKNVNYELLSDIRYEVTAKYGAHYPERGTAMPSTFIVDPEGVIRYRSKNDLVTRIIRVEYPSTGGLKKDRNPKDLVIAVLRALQGKLGAEACAAG